MGLVLYLLAFVAGCVVTYFPKVRGHAVRGVVIALAVLGALAALALII